MASAYYNEIYAFLFLGPTASTIQPMPNPPDPKQCVCSILCDLCATSATVEEMWSWNPHPLSRFDAPFESNEQDPHELDKRHGQALLHEREALAEVLAYRGGDATRKSLLWLDDETIVKAIETMNPVTGEHPKYGPIEWWATGKVKDMSYLFGMKECFDGDLSGWDVSAVTKMESTFEHAITFKGRGLHRWDVSAVKYMRSMFCGAKHFNADLGRWDVSAVTCFRSMFARALEFEGRGLHNWNFPNAKSMSHMFFSAHKFNADIGGWNVSAVTNIEGMFFAAIVFDADLSRWDVSNVQECGDAFTNAKTLKEKHKPTHFQRFPF